MKSQGFHNILKLTGDYDRRGQGHQRGPLNMDVGESFVLHTDSRCNLEKPNSSFDSDTHNDHLIQSKKYLKIALEKWYEI